jgi:hypothetical protein
MPRQRIDDDDDFEITADGHRVLKDGRTARVSCNDAAAARTVPIVPLRFTDGRTDVPIGSRPGFISAADSEAVRRAAYEQSCRDLCNAWRAPDALSVRSDAAPPDPRRPISFADAERIRGEAYRAMCAELQGAWRTKSEAVGDSIIVVRPLQRNCLPLGSQFYCQTRLFRGKMPTMVSGSSSGLAQRRRK